MGCVSSQQQNSAAPPPRALRGVAELSAQHSFGGASDTLLHFAAEARSLKSGQDRFSFAPKLDATVGAARHECTFVAVCDGHGKPDGGKEAQLAAASLPSVLQRELLARSVGESQSRGGGGESEAMPWEATFTTHQEARDAAYEAEKMEPALALKAKCEAEAGVSIPMEMPTDCGTTATCVAIIRDEIAVAWVGDSRAILVERCDGGKGGAEMRGVALTEDHDTAHETEAARACGAGAVISDNYVGVSGVEGMLQVRTSTVGLMV